MSAAMSLARRNISNPPSVRHLTPREVEEPLAARPWTAGPRRSRPSGSATTRTSTVHAASVASPRTRSYGFLADLDRDVHVVALDAVAGEVAAGEIVALDPDLHRQPVRFASLSSQVPTTIEYSSGWGRKPSDA